MPKISKFGLAIDRYQQHWGGGDLDDWSRPGELVRHTVGEWCAYTDVEALVASLCAEINTLKRENTDLEKEVNAYRLADMAKLEEY